MALKIIFILVLLLNLPLLIVVVLFESTISIPILLYSAIRMRMKRFARHAPLD
jgi:hypothetical protein